jgi:hypothetical protein
MTPNKLFILLVTFCLLFLTGRHLQAQGPAIDTMKIKRLDTLFHQLETADSVRIIVDQIVTRSITDDYKLSRPDSTKLVKCKDSLHHSARYLKDTLHHITDSFKIELADYDSAFKAYNLQIDSFTFDTSGNIGEQNFRDYQDARFRFIFAKSALIKAINSYQIQVINTFFPSFT